MPEPLDFSSTGVKKAPPVPPKAPKRLPKGIGWSPRARIGGVVVVAVILVIVGLLVFGREGTKVGVDQALVAKGARYCQVAVDFDRVVENALRGADLVNAPGSVLQGILAQVGGSIDEMTTTAPSEIRSEVAATVKALRDAANGDPAALRSAVFLEQRQRIDSFRQKSCSGGSGSGES